jgi:hypothetical protein
MMNNQINRDLDAQKTTQANRQNWYNLSMQHEHNKYQNALLNLQAQGAGLSNVQGLAKTALSLKQADDAGAKGLDGAYNAYSAGVASVLDSYQRVVNNMPDGPNKIAAQNSLDQGVKPYFNTQIANKAKETEAQKNVVIANANKPVDTSFVPQAIDNQKYKSGVLKGSAQKSAIGYISGDAIDPDDRNAIDQEVKDRSALLKQYAGAADASNQLAGIANAGQIPGSGLVKSAGTAVGSMVGGITGLLTGGGYGATAGTGGGATVGHGLASVLQETFERKRQILRDSLLQTVGKDLPGDQREALLDSMLPSWADTPETRNLAFQKLKDHFSRLDNFPKSEKYGLKTPLPNYQFNPAMPKDLPKAKSKAPMAQESDTMGGPTGGSYLGNLFTGGG